ncbi:MAG TPA: hypothetical protein VE988_09810 [Gemmataceae bacterium]|nr:hypothetical protein [Gemmataceae bacterium]
MSITARLESNSAMLGLMAGFDAFEGICDPAFDNDYEELERQFAELRLNVASDLN